MVEWKPLTGVVKADAVIVGGGWTGLLIADALSRTGQRVVVADAGQPHVPPVAAAHPWASYSQIAASAGPDAARSHAQRLLRVCRTLPAELSPLTACYEAERYHFALLEEDLPALHAYMALAASVGLPVQDAPDAGGCPFPVERSAMAGDALLIDPAHLQRSLTRRILRTGGKLCGQSLVTELASGRVFTAAGRIDAPATILACGRPPGLRRVSRFVSLTVAHCSLRGGPPLFTLQRSVRPGGLTLLPVPGGVEASFVAGRTGARGENCEISRFRRILSARLPDFSQGPLHFSQLAFPADGLPMIGECSAYPGRTLLACGIVTFAEAALAARIICRLLTGKPLPDDACLSPDRASASRPRRRTIRRIRALRTLNSLRRGAPRCSLCGCRLRWCEGAQWWGCPVCGSAFGLLGRRRSGPAVGNTQASALQRPVW